MCLQTLSFTDIIDTVVRQKICYDINDSCAAEAQIKIAALICINDKNTHRFWLHFCIYKVLSQLHEIY